MSNFILKIKHPVTGQVVEAEFFDNYFGRHKYGVRVRGEEKVYREDEIKEEEQKE